MIIWYISFVDLWVHPCLFTWITHLYIITTQSLTALAVFNRSPKNGCGGQNLSHNQCACKDHYMQSHTVSKHFGSSEADCKRSESRLQNPDRLQTVWLWPDRFQTARVCMWSSKYMYATLLHGGVTAQGGMPIYVRTSPLPANDWIRNVCLSLNLDGIDHECHCRASLSLRPDVTGMRWCLVDTPPLPSRPLPLPARSQLHANPWILRAASVCGTKFNPRPTGGGYFEPPPLVFLRYLLNQCRYHHQTCSTLSPNILHIVLKFWSPWYHSSATNDVRVTPRSADFDRK